MEVSTENFFPAPAKNYCTQLYKVESIQHHICKHQEDCLGEPGYIGEESCFPKVKWIISGGLYNLKCVMISSTFGDA